MLTPEEEKEEEVMAFVAVLEWCLCGVSGDADGLTEPPPIPVVREDAGAWLKVDPPDVERDG